MRKRILSIIMAAVMVTSFTACGTKSKNTKKASVANTQAETEAETTTKTLDIKVSELEPLEEAGVITGVEDLKVAEGTDIDLNELIYADKTIVMGVDVDDSDVKYDKAGTYEVKYAITFDGDELRDYIAKNDITLTFDTADADTIIVNTTVKIEVLTEEEVKEAIEEAEKEADESDDTDDTDKSDKSDKTETSGKTAKINIITNDTKDDVQKENQSKANDNAVQSKPAPEPETTKAAVKTEQSSDNVVKADEKTTAAKATEKSTTAKQTEKATTAKPTQKPTEKVTEKQTTAKPTEKATEKVTQKPTEKVTQKPTEKPTEKQTTAKPTERVTEKPTEAPKPVHTHSYNSSVTKQPTCDNAGVRTYTCSCGSSYTESIPATGHNWEHHDAVYETVTVTVKEAYDEPVYVDHTICVQCGKVLYELDHKMTHEDEMAIVDALWAHWDESPTCGSYTNKVVQKGTIHHDAVTETRQELVSPAYDVCKTCGARK